MENCRSHAFQVSQKLYIMTGVYNNKYKNTTKPSRSVLEVTLMGQKLKHISNVCFV